MHAKRPLTLLLGAAGASMSASAGFLYMGDDVSLPKAPQPLASQQLPSQLPQPDTRRAKQQAVNDQHSRNTPQQQHAEPSKPRAKALSKQELGLDQSLARDFACLVSSASVFAARRAFYASSASKNQAHDTSRSTNHTTSGSTRSTGPTSNMYHHLVGWLQELARSSTAWDADQVIQSSSFALLLHLISSSQQTLRQDLEHELYDAVGVLATNAQCAKAITERATRYGKHALLNLAQSHDRDTRVGDALHRLVLLDGPECRFGPANLVSLLALAVADVPDEYLAFALWGLRKAASPHARSAKYEWRKALFGDDATAKTRRKLIANDKLWTALMAICNDDEHQRSDTVLLEAAKLMCELSDDPAIARALQRHDASTQMLMHWMTSTNVPLVCTALEIVANVVRHDENVRATLLAMGALDVLRARVLENNDCRMTAALLQAVRCIAAPSCDRDGAAPMTPFALNRDALSFLQDDDDDEHPLHHDDFVTPTSVTKRQYVDGWIELFTAFLTSQDEQIRDEAAKCLEQISDHGAHHDQAKQEWLISILDAVLRQVPLEIAMASTSVRAAKSRTRPIAGHATERSNYEIAHAKALRALAYVLGRKECQQDFVRRGGIPLLKLLMRSENQLVQRETARVLANLFTCNNMHDDVRDFVVNDTQLTSVLEQWTQSKDIQLQSIAHRARSNRRYQIQTSSDKKRMSTQHKSAPEEHVKYLDGVHPLHFSSTTDDASAESDSSSPDETNTSRRYDVDVVLIHGLLGCPYETWMCGDDETTMWAQQWLLPDLQRDGTNPRVLSIGYDAQLLSSDSAWSTMSFESTSHEIRKKLNAARVGTGDRPVIFVTHSLGGVLLKQVLHDSMVESPQEDGSLVDNVNGVLFYGVPHHGSPVAQMIHAFRPRSLGINQHPVTEHLHGTPHSEMLNDWCAALFEEKGIPALSIGESVPCRLPVIGVEALVVPPSSANPGFGDFVTVPDATHMSVCKPSAQSDLRYTLAYEFIAKRATASNEVASRTSDMASSDVE
uniref:Protein SERAC1 n=1 Tax=Globisporangium ultimum (strain ATCC 200006 / CBS 805.95 / DAOM BR144) TaxID=431595 RepID=K3WNH7_GLOUD